MGATEITAAGHRAVHSSACPSSCLCPPHAIEALVSSYQDLSTTAGGPLYNQGAFPILSSAAAGRLGPPSPPRRDSTGSPTAPTPRMRPSESTSTVLLPAPLWQPTCARATVQRQQRLFAATKDISLSGCSLLDTFQVTGLDDTSPTRFTARAHTGKGLGGCPAIAPLGKGAARAGGCPGLYRYPRASQGERTLGGKREARASAQPRSLLPRAA